MLRFCRLLRILRVRVRPLQILRGLWKLRLQMPTLSLSLSLAKIQCLGEDKRRETLERSDKAKVLIGGSREWRCGGDRRPI